MIAVTLDRPWLTARLPRPMRVLSWAPHGGGWRVTDTILWREVRNTDLQDGLDAETWLAAQMPDAGAVGMLTSRDVGSWVAHRVQVEGIEAACVATLGLSNAESVGQRLAWHSADSRADALSAGRRDRDSSSRGPTHWGTINIAVAVAAGLTETAQLEAMSIAVQARTAAVMDLGLKLATGTATGTGTDCLALACDPGAGRYAGLHTPVGEAVGAAVRGAVSRAARDWMDWRNSRPDRKPG